jgi:CheY-like chemotaxis protein
VSVPLASRSAAFAGPDAQAERAAAVRPRLTSVPAPDTGGRSAGAPARVLVVDDEPAMRALCRVNLQLDGMEVLEARDGREAVTVAAAEHPDLVLLDVMMPGLDGWHVAEQLESDPGTREIPIVFMTALAAADDRRRGAAAGAVGYLTKPYDPLELGTVVKRTLERLARGEREALRDEIVEQT